jgi:hypothetical protein
MTAMAHSSASTPGDGTVIRRERRRVSLGGFIALEDGTTAEVHVLDLSYDGCGIETAIALESGQAIMLSVPHRGAIEANVRWCGKGRAGLVFKADADPGKHQQPRKSERHSLSADARLRRLGGANYMVRVSDLSPHGCKVELIDRPREGERMFVKFDGLEALEAEVCWVDGPWGGLRFETPIHPAVLDLMVDRLK